MCCANFQPSQCHGDIAFVDWRGRFSRRGPRIHPRQSYSGMVVPRGKRKKQVEDRRGDKRGQRGTNGEENCERPQCPANRVCSQKFSSYNGDAIPRAGAGIPRIRGIRRTGRFTLTSSVKRSEAIPVIAGRKFYKATRAPLSTRCCIGGFTTAGPSKTPPGKWCSKGEIVGFALAYTAAHSNVLRHMHAPEQTRREKEERYESSGKDRETVGKEGLRWLVGTGVVFDGRGDGARREEEQRDKRWLSFHRARRDRSIVRQPTNNQSKG